VGGSVGCGANIQAQHDDASTVLARTTEAAHMGPGDAALFPIEAICRVAASSAARTPYSLAKITLL
jgi:hypothetical protein